MYSNNILNLEESMTILNYYTKTCGNLLKSPRTFPTAICLTGIITAKLKYEITCSLVTIAPTWLCNIIKGDNWLFHLWLIDCNFNWSVGHEGHMRLRVVRMSGLQVVLKITARKQLVAYHQLGQFVFILECHRREKHESTNLPKLGVNSYVFRAF